MTNLELIEYNLDRAKAQVNVLRHLVLARQDELSKDQIQKDPLLMAYRNQLCELNNQSCQLMNSRQKELQTERILGVAMLVFNKLNYSKYIFQLPAPNRHPHLFIVRCTHFNFDVPCAHYWDSHIESQGFYTNKRRFIDRKEAKKIALERGQALDPDNLKSELFSEDLW
jgi:hypothetical protein